MRKHRTWLAAWAIAALALPLCCCWTHAAPTASKAAVHDCCEQDQAPAKPHHPAKDCACTSLTRHATAEQTAPTVAPAVVLAPAIVWSDALTITAYSCVPATLPAPLRVLEPPGDPHARFCLYRC